MQSSISWGMMKGRVWVVFNQVTITKRWTEKLFGETSWKHPAFILVERSEGANSVWNFEAGLHEVYQIQRSLSSHRKHKKISAQNTFQIPGNGISKAYLLHRIRKNRFCLIFSLIFTRYFKFLIFQGEVLRLYLLFLHSLKVCVKIKIINCSRPSSEVLWQSIQNFPKVH